MSKLDQYTLECVRSMVQELRKDAYESEEISAFNAVDMELAGMLELDSLDLDFPDTREQKETRAKLLAMGVAPAFLDEPTDHDGTLPLDEFLEYVKQVRPGYDILEERFVHERRLLAEAVDLDFHAWYNSTHNPNKQ